MRSRTPTRIALYVILALAALVFIFPFYFMIVGALQENPTTTPAGMFPTGGWTWRTSPASTSGSRCCVRC